jgi:serine/threonine protein kinase/uncharacterized membrane protein
VKEPSPQHPQEDSDRRHYFALPLGSRLFEFEIVAVLGHGGFGITYLAMDALLEERVALKEFFPNELAVRVTDATVRAKSGADQPEFQSGLKTFLEEARIIARFRHRNIVHVRRFFELHGTGYIVQDYEAGQTVTERLKDGPIDETDLRRILNGILDGLEAVHERAILHRDLKPDNIILRMDGSPVLIDFGAARDFASRQSRSVTAIAAGSYTSPEQWGAGGQQGPWSDLYSLGAIAYRCVTGTAPPVSLQRLRADPLVPAAIAACDNYGPALLETIDWMLKVDEEQRPASIQAVRNALQGRSNSPRTAYETSQAPVKVVPANSGQVALVFEQQIAADVLELAFFVEPPGNYLNPSTDHGSIWTNKPYYISLNRSEGDRSGTSFLVDAESVSRISGRARVTVSSEDNFISATTNWPDFKLKARSQPKRWPIAAGIVIALAVGASGYWFYAEQGTKFAEPPQWSKQAEIQRWTQRLEQASFDRVAIEQLLRSCDTSCPTNIKEQAQRRLDLIVEELSAYQAAQDDPDKLRAYIQNCKACNLKSDAEKRIELVESQKQKETKQKEERDRVARDEARAYQLARGDLQKLQRYVSTCTVCSFSEAANQGIDALQRANAQGEALHRDEQAYGQARGNLNLLKAYVQNCGTCSYKASALEEITKLNNEAQFFMLKVCNKSSRKASVAVMGQTALENNDKHVQGWWSVPPGQCNYIRRYVKGVIYLFAQEDGNPSFAWKGNASQLCVASPGPFDRVNRDGYTCQTAEKTVPFSSFSVSEGTFTWDLNP